MNNKIKKIFSVLLCAVMFLSLFTVTGFAEDKHTTTIEAEITEGIIQQDSIFEIVISVKNATALDSVDCDVRFDDEYLEFYNMQGNLTHPGLSSNCNYWGDGHAQFESVFDNGSFTGSAEIIYMTFKAYSEGEHTVNINVNSWQGKNQPENITFTFYVGDPDKKPAPKGLTYEIKDNEVTITDCVEEYNGRLDIPAEIDGYPVTAIGESALFSCNKITSVTIPESVTSISANSLTSCDALEKIIVDENNQHYSSDDRGALFDKAKSKIIRYPIGNSATEYIIPDGVITICESAFAHAENLKSITIPNTVTAIEPVAFLSTWKLEGIVIPESVTEISGNAFSCSGIKWAVVPEGIVNIAPRTFDCCSSLEYIILPSSLVSVDAFAFSMCKNLTDVYYAGSESDWNNITVSEQNSALLNADIHYNSAAFIPFDADGNGKITAADARLALRAASRLELLEGNYFNAADIDKDGKITASDARKILRKAAGLD